MSTATDTLIAANEALIAAIHAAITNGTIQPGLNTISAGGRTLQFSDPVKAIDDLHKQNEVLRAHQGRENGTRPMFSRHRSGRAFGV